MRRCLLALICFGISALRVSHSLAGESASSQSPSGKLANQLIGAWRLLSVETVRQNGVVIYPFYGKHPEGLLVYDRSGWMSVQIVSDPQPTRPLSDSREGFLAAPASERLSALEGYYAYFGTWSVDPVALTVTHRIRQSLYPGERNESGVRKLSLEGSRLTLLANAHEMGEDHQRRLVWERITP